jgi:hypothetical protein
MASLTQRVASGVHVRKEPPPRAGGLTRGPAPSGLVGLWAAKSSVFSGEPARIRPEDHAVDRRDWKFLAIIATFRSYLDYLTAVSQAPTLEEP